MRSIVEDNKEAYDRVAIEYSQRKPVFDENNRRIIGIFIDFLNKRYAGRAKREISILDVGVGSGLDLSIFEKEGYQTFGIDISDKMIESARNNSPHSTYYCGDFIPFQFDRIFSGLYAQAFVHLFPKSEVSKVFEKIYSVVEPQGLIHFSTTIHPESSEGWEEKKDYQQKVERFRKRWTLDELNDFLKKLPDTNIVHQYQVRDPMGKEWVNTIISRQI